ncbi:MAG: valine--tRNA ligase, partial [Myxococcales bacterium]|nr:valine--tRNA ligase [Myxococcales bacterium]
AAVSMGREVERLGVAANAATLGRLEAVREDVMAGARVREHRLEERVGLEDGVFEIESIEFADR